MKPKSKLLVAFTVFLVLVSTPAALAGTAASEDEFAVLEQELQKSLQDGKLAIPQRPGSGDEGIEGEEPAELCEGMFHRITFSAKGTRSEARHGFIEVEGYTLPDVFTEVVYRGIGVGFRTRSHMWGDDGYWPDARVSLPEEKGPALSAEARERGWAMTDETPEKLPENWAFVKWKDGSAFVTADCLKDFVEEMELPLLERYGELMEIPREETTPKMESGS